MSDATWTRLDAAQGGGLLGQFGTAKEALLALANLINSEGNRTIMINHWKPEYGDFISISVTEHDRG